MRRHTFTSRSGYSFPELMAVIALICVLAALAQPLYDRWVNVAKRSEACQLVESIREFETAYRMMYDAYITATSAPSGTLDGTPDPWDGGVEWDMLGFEPDGDVRCHYAVQDMTTDFVVTAQCDVDSDGVVADYSATRTEACTLDPSDYNVY